MDLIGRSTGAIIGRTCQCGSKQRKETRASINILFITLLILHRSISRTGIISIKSVAYRQVVVFIHAPAEDGSWHRPSSTTEMLKVHNFSQLTDCCCRTNLNSQHQSDKLADGVESCVKECTTEKIDGVLYL